MQANKVTHLFKANSKFEDVIALYNFDRELRLLLFDVIERIEIALRTKMIYYLSHVGISDRLASGALVEKLDISKALLF